MFSEDVREEEQVQYPRYFRHIKINPVKTGLFLVCFLILPIILEFYYMDRITYLMCRFGEIVLKKSGAPFVTILSGDLHGFKYYFLNVRETFPSVGLIIVNIIASFGVLTICGLNRIRERVLSLTLTIAGMFHLMVSLYFYFARYEVTIDQKNYSMTYMVMQLGLWIGLIGVMGYIMGITGDKGYIRKILLYISFLAYSFLFGTLRYVLVMYFIYKYSILYGPVLFFFGGVILDVFYVNFYMAIFVRHTVKHNKQEKKAGTYGFY